jgi:hypothetical protein
MTNYAPLQAEWPNLSGTTAQKIATLNAMTVAGPNQDVPVSSVVAYLALDLKLATLKNYAASPPSGSNASVVAVAQNFVAMLSVNEPPPFEMSNPMIYSAISGFLTTLATDTNTGIVTADVTALLALAATTLPWWEANGYAGPITGDDLAAAGGLT